MIKNLLFIIAISILLVNCKTNKKQGNSFRRDIALRSYLQSLDSLPYYDTTDLNYKALKAYQNNDSSFFIEYEKEQRRKTEFLKQFKNIDTCVKVKKLQDLKVEQAYRFIYTPAFCSTPIIATVTKNGDSIKLQFIVYQNHYDTAQCRLINEINMNLTNDNWNDFYNKLLFADIWGSKRENGIHGFDGSTMKFMAYENVPSTRQPRRQWYVERWEFSTLRESFDFILKLSKNKKGCIWFE